MKVNKIPLAKAEQIEASLKQTLNLVQQVEEQYGDECIMDVAVANRVNELLDSIGAFVINSLN